jgi:hypothetical protein
MDPTMICSGGSEHYKVWHPCYERRRGEAKEEKRRGVERSEVFAIQI